MAKKALDANIIIYALLADHPAAEVCEAYIADSRHKFYTTALTPFEVYFILHRVYGVPRSDAGARALSLLDAPLTVVDVTSSDLRGALQRCVESGLDTNDSLLIQMCLRLEIPVLASDDRRLLTACEKEGIHPECPLEEEHRQLMREWEKTRLFPAGAPRVLGRVYAWLRDTDPRIASSFLEASGRLRHPP